MADYSKIFAGSGGLLNAFSDRSSLVNFTSSLAEKAALGLYMKNYAGANKAIQKSTGRDLPSGLEFLAGDNIVSDVLRGGYQPHVGAYLAHKVGGATFQAMNAVFDVFAPGMSKSFKRRYEELKKVQYDKNFVDSSTTDRSTLDTQYVLESFKTIADQHPGKFQEVFFKQFNSAYLTGDRFFCLLEDETDPKRVYDEKYIDHNRHYQAFLAKNVTVPSVDIETVEFTRFNQKFSIPGNPGQNESISVNYMVDYHNILYHKLYNFVQKKSFVTDSSKFFTMYLIINNPYQYIGRDWKDVPVNGNAGGLSSKDSSLAFQTHGMLPSARNNILCVYKFKGVHVKNINQISYDTTTSDFINMPVVFNHNGVETEFYGYDFHDGANNSFDREYSTKFDWLLPSSR